MNKRLILQAGEHALGTLDVQARLELGHTLEHDPELRAEVEFWEATLAPLALEVQEMKPSDTLWTRIERALESEPPPGTHTLRHDEGTWHTVLPGVEKKQLHVDARQGMESFLLRLAPGAVLPQHVHQQTEQCLVLEGEIHVGGHRCFAGDFHVAPEGVNHPAIASETGALLYLHGELRDAHPPA